MGNCDSFLIRYGSPVLGIQLTIIPSRGLTNISIALTAVGRDDACFDSRTD